MNNKYILLMSISIIYLFSFNLASAGPAEDICSGKKNGDACTYTTTTNNTRGGGTSGGTQSGYCDRTNSDSDPTKNPLTCKVGTDANDAGLFDCVVSGDVCVDGGKKGQCESSTSGTSVRNQTTTWTCNTSGKPDSSSTTLNSGGTTDTSSATTTAGTVSYESYTNFPGVGRISSLCQLITALWYLGFAVLLTSVLGMFLYGGYIYVTAGVNAGKVNQAKEIFTNTITGLIIGLSIFIIINVINPGLLQGNCSIPSVGSGSTIGGGGGTTPLSGNCKEIDQSIWKCQRGGCSDSYFGLSSVDKQLYPVITEIFKTCSSKGNFQISSAYRPWSSGSFHQTGKAVDFADGANDNFTLLPTGKCVMDVAKQCGISASRVNPGTDAAQTFHVHIDLGR